MMRYWKFYILIILQLTTIFAQIFDIAAPPANIETAGDNDQCATFCDKTYPAHTFEKSEASKSCKQGCRLFSMLQFVVGNRGAPANESLVRETCVQDCTEAYADHVTRQACADGCRNQSVHHSGPFQVKMDDSSPLFGKAMKSFQDQFSTFQNQMMNHVQNARDWFNRDFPQLNELEEQMNARMQNFINQVEKSYSDEDADHLENPLFNFAANRFGGRPQITQQPRPGVSGEKSSNNDMLNKKPLQTLTDPFKGPRVGNSDENGEPVIIVHMESNNVPSDNGRPEPVVPSDNDHSDEDSTMLKESANEPSPPIDQSLIIDDPDDDWLSCLARRARRLSVITRWMLCIALMLSVASMIWICLAIMRTAPRRRLLLTTTNEKKPMYDVVYSTPPATASDKSPMIICTKEPLNMEGSESPPPPYRAAPIHGKAPEA